MEKKLKIHLLQGQQEYWELFYRPLLVQECLLLSLSQLVLGWMESHSEKLVSKRSELASLEVKLLLKKLL
jgi:hypothetical protein